MRLCSVTFLLLLCVLSSATFGQSQNQSVPRLINITGVFRPADGQSPATSETVTFAIYADSSGGTPVWQETQTIAVDDRGRYSVLLGATQPAGLPSEIFASAQAHWLGTRFERLGEVEGPRVRLTSVPYALKAADAETLGGRPASDYVVATAAASDNPTTTKSSSDVSAPSDVLPGTTNYLAKYVNSTDVGPSSIFDAGGAIGVGTNAPLDALHVKFTNTFGSMTGLAVQNMGNTANSYSGMLFYDQNGALGQFQGFNNVTHEYRVNNVARNFANQFDGSINFMVGGLSRFYVTPNGNVGIGTSAPVTSLDIRNNPPSSSFGVSPASIQMTSYGSNAPGYPPAIIIGRTAGGTTALPQPIGSFQNVLSLIGQGYDGTGFSGSASINFRTAETWATSRDMVIDLNTGGNSGMTVGSAGVGIGTTSPSSSLEVSDDRGFAATPAVVTATTFGTAARFPSFVGRKARPFPVGQMGVLSGDTLVSFEGRGFGQTGFGSGGASMLMRASQAWTDTAQGAAIDFMTTPNGTATPIRRLTLDHAGNLGVGTTAPVAPLEVLRTDSDAAVVTTGFSSVSPSVPFYFARASRGTPSVSAPLLTGDLLGMFGAGGRGTTEFSGMLAGMTAIAAEIFTDTSQGTFLEFENTPLGAIEPSVVISVLPSGFVGIGTPLTGNNLPTATDRLQVFGDIRVGTTGTNGCIKDFSGAGILGTCSSDRRLKKNITPSAPMLDKVTALQPVHYFWRSDEFPNRHFGNSQNYGLIAQDVEQILPELVATDSDGFKAVDYSKLPLLTIQAVKELKAENDALKQQVVHLKEQVDNDPLKQRVAELERLITEMLSKQK